MRDPYQMFTLLAFNTLISLVGISDQHGRMLEPPARNTMWRFGFKTPANYNDNELFCGGIGGIIRNEGKCGICGDPFDGQRIHETGQMMANNQTTRNYFPGSSIDVMIEIVANHGGTFEFDLCRRNKFEEVETEECFEPLNLNKAGGGDEKMTLYELNPELGAGTYSMSLELPLNMTCERCVLRWHWRAANNWAVCDDGSEAIGCGYQEVYRNCADISIQRNGAGVGLG